MHNIVVNILVLIITAVANLLFFTQYLRGLEDREHKRKPRDIGGWLRWIVSQFYVFIAAGLFLIPFFPGTFVEPIIGYNYEFNHELFYTLVTPVYSVLFGSYWLILRQKKKRRH